LASLSPRMDLSALAEDISTLFATAASSGTSGTSSLRRLSITFPNGISPAVRKTLEIRTERFLDSLSDYLHAEAASEKPDGTTNDLDSITLRFVISQSALEDE